MNPTRITPRFLITTMLALVGLRLAFNLLGYSESAYSWGGPTAILRTAGKVAAYAIAIPLCLGVAAEYRRQQLLRLAWICMALSAMVSIVRYLLDTQLIEAIHPGYWHGETITVLREAPSAISLFFLAAGIAGMGVAFFRTGLGFSLRKTDLAAIGAAVLFLLLIFYFRNEMSLAARLENETARRSQFMSDVFFAIAAAGAVVLHRFAQQMGGGQLALAMEWLIAHVTTRAALIVLLVIRVRLAIPHTSLIENIIYDCTPWMFVTAAAYRHGIALTANRQATEWGAQQLHASAARSR